jgi:uncharacterized protein (TIGR03435 family)
MTRMLVCTMVVASFVALAQTLPTPQFEVAAVKQNTSGSTDEQIYIRPGGRFSVRNMTVRVLIQNAYQLMSFQISGGPSWIDSERFDIDAKSDGDTTPNGLLVMVRTLLDDRFGMKGHREMRYQSVFFLTVAKGGAKIQHAEGTCVPRDPNHPPRQPTRGEPVPNYCGGMHRSSQSLDGTGEGIADTSGFTLGTLSGQLSSILGRAVIDKTGLTGIFNFHLRWAGTQDTTSTGNAKAGALSDAPSIFTALQEQLGLKLESAKGPVEVLVIDHVEKPTEN